MSERWPRLGLDYHPALDWVIVDHAKASLLRMADDVAAHRHTINTRTINPRTKKEGPAAWNFTLETLLRSLASNKEAQTALNREHLGDAKPPLELVKLNRAVHVHVMRAKGSSAADAEREVARLWGVKGSSVRADVARHKLEKPLVFNGGVHDAEHLAEYLIAHAEAKLKSSRHKAAEAVDNDMVDRSKPYRDAKKSRGKF